MPLISSYVAHQLLMTRQLGPYLTGGFATRRQSAVGIDERGSVTSPGRLLRPSGPPSYRLNPSANEKITAGAADGPETDQP